MAAKSILDKLATAARRYDRDSASSLISDLGGALDGDNGLSETNITDAVKKLRSNRWFDEIGHVFRLAVKAGQNSPGLRRHFAQCLIEAKKFDKALSLLQSVLDDTSPTQREHSEALGLMGRTFKQIYVDDGDDEIDAAQAAALRSSALRYREGFQLNHSFDQRIWHGINLAAVLYRAEADELPVDQEGEWRQITSSLLEEITRLAASSDDGLNSWDYATAGEAAFALGDSKKAEHWFELYRESNPDDFQIAGTIRQLRELWGKSFDDPETGGLLLRLQALAVRTENVETEFNGAELAAAQSLANDAPMLFPQGRINDADYQTVHWFVTALDRARAVVQLGTGNPEIGSGTGFVVGKDDLLGSVAGDDRFADWPDYVALTNAHVTTDDEDTRLNPPYGPDGTPLYHSMAPARARVNFRAQHSLDGRWPSQHGVDQLWTSPFSKLDITILEIKDWTPPDGFEPCPIATTPPSSNDKQMYLIGHPGGHGLRFSTDGSDYLGHSDGSGNPDPARTVKLRYASPTEAGSSGSPVFPGQDWDVIGVHQGMVRDLDGPDGKKFNANQGIWIESVRHALVAS